MSVLVGLCKSFCIDLRSGHDRSALQLSIGSGYKANRICCLISLPRVGEAWGVAADMRGLMRRPLRLSTPCLVPVVAITNAI
jgi:hypothetical protein